MTQRGTTEYWGTKDCHTVMQEKTRAGRGRPVSGRNREAAETGERKAEGKRESSPPLSRPGVQPGLSAERPSFRRVLDCGQQAKTVSPRPSGVLAPSRVQRRGVLARRVREPCEGGGAQWARSPDSESGRCASVRRGWKGGEAREHRDGGTSRAARQRREVVVLRLLVVSDLLVIQYGGFNEVQETPPV